MGEFATRISDGANIKIGTCEDMYYLRFEDRHKVAPLSGNVNVTNDAEAGMVRFRLPFPDEDDVRPGDYKDYNRGLRIYRGNDDFTDPSTIKEPGTIQLSHPSGLLLSVPCYHGEKLPDLGTVKPGWNGKSWSLELYQLRPVLKDGVLQVFPVIRCRWCGGVWRYLWSDVIEYIPEPMKARLAVYAKEGMQAELTTLNQ